MENWDLSSLEVPAHQPRILRTDEGAARAIAILLPAGEELQEHQVHEHAYVLVASGEAEFISEQGEATGGPGFLAHYEPRERHTIRARSDTRLLLLLAPWPGPGHPGSPG